MHDKNVYVSCALYSTVYEKKGPARFCFLGRTMSVRLGFEPFHGRIGFQEEEEEDDDDDSK
jgi:hypothetical protein